MKVKREALVLLLENGGARWGAHRQRVQRTLRSTASREVVDLTADGPQLVRPQPLDRLRTAMAQPGAFGPSPRDQQSPSAVW